MHKRTKQNDKNVALRKELLRISSKNKGILNPQDVIDVAKDKNNILHDYFDWDDSHAANEFRLIQARQLITSVTITYNNNEDPVQLFVSLTTDRFKGAEGYRQIVDVVKNPEHREQLLKDALKELVSFQEKYKRFRELSNIFKETKRLKEVYNYN